VEDLVKATRLDAFRTDPRLTDTESAHCADYAGSGYDRGHIVPRDDMNRTPAVQANTFFLSNMTPQTPNLNQGMWRWLEELVRTYVTTYGRVYIISGGIFTSDRTVPSGQVAVLSHFYKVLIRQPDTGDPILLALVLPNRVSNCRCLRAHRFRDRALPPRRLMPISSAVSSA
jgi:endonuclease G